MLFLAIFLLTVLTIASASPIMQSSSPSGGEVLSKAPETTGLVSHHAIRLTSPQLSTSSDEEISIKAVP